MMVGSKALAANDAADDRSLCRALDRMAGLHGWPWRRWQSFSGPRGRQRHVPANASHRFGHRPCGARVRAGPMITWPRRPLHFSKRRPPRSSRRRRTRSGRGNPPCVDNYLRHHVLLVILFMFLTQVCYLHLSESQPFLF